MMASPLLEFRTPNYHPYAVRYSPYYDHKLAAATSSYFGLVGNGRLYCLTVTPEGNIVPSNIFDTNDALYDVAWSELNEHQLVAACGDGSVKLFDVSLSSSSASASGASAAAGMPDPENAFPIANFHEHKRECLSVQWNPIEKGLFATSSWDGTVKIWTPEHNHQQPTDPSLPPSSAAALRTLPIGSCCYSVAWSPRNPNLISAASSDSAIRLFDLRTPPSAAYHMTAKILAHSPPAFFLPSNSIPPAQHPAAAANPANAAGATAAPTELLSHDWNKYRDGIVAVGGVDGVVRTFDLRHPSGGPLCQMRGHEFAVRRLAWSPHRADVLISASYDMTCRLWSDLGAGDQPAGMMAAGNVGARDGSQLGIMNRHTEFTTGVDWCLFGAGGWVASCGWDERVLLWDSNMLVQS